MIEKNNNNNRELRLNIDKRAARFSIKRWTYFIWKIKIEKESRRLKHQRWLITQQLLENRLVKCNTKTHYGADIKKW